jgi:hypothetical protein
MSAADKLALAMIPEIEIWRAARLMLKRYGEKALEESAARADELFAEQDHDNAAVLRRIIDAVGQLANTKPSGRPLFAADNHRRQKLSPLIDRINDRYGRCSIGFGLFPPDVRAFKGHAAFHRVPERWEF